MTVLSVNLNKVALLRNGRGEGKPDLHTAVETCLAAGCHGITVHPRPDQRHIRPDDVREIAAQIRGRVEFNIEGNPFAGPRGEYPGLIELVRESRPSQVTLVPDGDAQLTSDHGFDPAQDCARLAPLIAALRELDCRVSLFVDARVRGLETFAQLGAQRIEIYTGPYAKAFTRGNAEEALQACVACANAAYAAGLGVNAGHDLDQSNLGALVAAIPRLAEVSIGHALISEALYAGLAPTVRNYVGILDR
ncbi:MAG: pyridoxine 5'-phosphate synthase [Xanthomonadales bacterium]|nr:pyridoxine 5'-phosphate synthase [Xanthomonadales bacterium]